MVADKPQHSDVSEFKKGQMTHFRRREAAIVRLCDAQRGPGSVL